MSEKVEIKTLEIAIGKKQISLTIKEARELFEAFGNIFENGQTREIIIE